VLPFISPSQDGSQKNDWLKLVLRFSKVLQIKDTEPSEQFRPSARRASAAILRSRSSIERNTAGG
jgi:hypothetical protein